ncbi:MAG: hypothetical protein P8L69_04785 [Alphaproteobacteria bacterium]|nr:hypothetical protein [Alphaproteobacteria bacterium]
MNQDNRKINEAKKIIKLAIEDYDAFLKLINTYTPEKKTEVINWLRNALKFVDKQQNNKKHE